MFHGRVTCIVDTDDNKSFVFPSPTPTPLGAPPHPIEYVSSFDILRVNRVCLSLLLHVFVCCRVVASPLARPTLALDCLVRCTTLTIRKIQISSLTYISQSHPHTFLCVQVGGSRGVVVAIAIVHLAKPPAG